MENRTGTEYPAAEAGAIRDQVNTLQIHPERDIMKRKVEIFSQLIRLTTAIIYLVAELHLGEKPEKL
jgi:hypothetical protein